MKKYIGILLLLIGVGGSFVVYFETSDTTMQDLFLGLIISVVASFIFFVLSEYFFKEEKVECEPEETLNLVKEVCGLQKEVSHLGINSIKMIDYLDNRDTLWIDILEHSTERLEIVAHTLSPWFSKKYVKEFSDTLIRLANNQKRIQILILDPAGTNLQLIAGGDVKGYARKIEDTLKKLENIWLQIEEANRHYLEVKLNGKYVIPYSYIRNDENTYISPYLCNNAQRSSFITICESESQIAKGFNGDFESVFAKADMRSYFPLEPSLDKIDVLESHIIKGNHYESIDWNIEDTQKYALKFEDAIAEIGYYIHYKKDGETIVDKTIELSTSFGCPFKCKYCASSNIKEVQRFNAEQLLKMVVFIYRQTQLNNKEKIHITLTGTGDYYYTHYYSNEFLKKANRMYPNNIYTISSCAWTKEMIKEVEDLMEMGVQFKFLQMTYISYKEECVKEVIPNYPDCFDMGNTIRLINCSKVRNKFRINYLMIKDINDEEKDFEEFLNIMEPLKDVIVVRIAKLNETSCTKINNLHEADDLAMEKLNELCEKRNMTSYIFRSYQNDNMNCGQLITDGKYR